MLLDGVWATNRREYTPRSLTAVTQKDFQRKVAKSAEVRKDNGGAGCSERSLMSFAAFGALAPLR